MVAPLRIPMNRETLVKMMEDEGFFGSLVRQFYGDYCKAAGFLQPQLSDSLMHDAWDAFHRDTKRLKDNMSTEPDHFKVCGFAAYWLRRHSPLIDLHEDNAAGELNEVAAEHQQLLAKCGRALLAFHFGYMICHSFETNRNIGRAFPRKPDKDYLETIGYVMKCKSLSPHAMWMIYWSLFFGSRGGGYD